MNKKLFLTLGALLVLGALAVTYSLTTAKQPAPVAANTDIPETVETPLPSPSATLQPGVVATFDPNRKPEIILNEGIPDTDQAQEVIHTIEKAHEIDVKAGRTLDPSEFPTVYINDPRFPVDSGTLDVVRRLSHNPSLQSAGWLDYKMAMVNSTKEERMRPKAENAIPTDTPMPSATIPPGIIYDPIGPPPPLIFQSLQIEGDIAKAVIDEGITTYELTLVFVDGKWYIAAYYGISVSP